MEKPGHPPQLAPPVLLLPLLLLLLTPTATADTGETPDTGETRFAFVQYQIDPTTYQNSHTFSRDVEELISQAVTTGAEVIVFPEYTNVFLATIPLSSHLTPSTTLNEGLKLLQNRYGPGTTLKDFFIHRSAPVRHIMDTVWGTLAQKYTVTIVAGTAFVAAPDNRLYNRLFVYTPDGAVYYTQDKAYLTPFETDIIGLDPGDPAQAQPIDLQGVETGLTICRDTFFDTWNRQFSDADLWIDLKANGTQFDTAQKENFTQALPERISETPVETGATVCLTGTFLHLFWEGTSSVIQSAPTPTGYTTQTKAPTDDTEHILYTDLPN